MKAKKFKKDKIYKITYQGKTKDCRFCSESTNDGEVVYVFCLVGDWGPFEIRKSDDVQIGAA